MRAVFRLRCGGARSLILREQTRGRLDRRRLAQASYQQRVFCRRVERPGPRPLVLGLLLDESGSMCRDNRAAVALEAAALLVESTRLLPGIRMEVFSHTSTGPRNRDCLLRRLYRSGQSDVHAVATYGRDMHENYDHQAILTAAAMLKAAASADAQRLLIVLSDGMPHGAQYAGKQAMDATREAAELVRRTGTQLLAIAIADYAAESIYDARYTLKYTQLQEFPQKFRSLLMRLLRRSAIG